MSTLEADVMTLRDALQASLIGSHAVDCACVVPEQRAGEHCDCGVTEHNDRIYRALSSAAGGPVVAVQCGEGGLPREFESQSFGEQLAWMARLAVSNDEWRLFLLYAQNRHRAFAIDFWGVKAGKRT